MREGRTSQPFILAHDIGTTGDKATLYDGDGRLLGRAFRGYETYYPRPTWAEQRPGDWREAVRRTTRELLERTAAAPGGAAAIEAIRLIGGFARSPLWRQILTDAYGQFTLSFANAEEVTSLGAAVIGGVALPVVKHDRRQFGFA